MYLSYYKLREFPFAITCGERFFYESATHSEALANMMYVVGQRKGMVLVSGEVGAGKTFVGNMLGSRLGAGCLVAMMANPPQSGKQLFRALATKVGISVRATADKLQLIEELEAHLIRMSGRGRLVALILDEAQDLSPTSLEEIRLLWNWEHNGQRLIQIVLIGQPELRQRLQEPKWEPLRQRIVLSYHIGPLSETDTGLYIAHRLKVAAEEGATVSFAPEAVADIYAATNGIPRLVNILCDNALLVGYTREAAVIERSVIAEVLDNMTCWGLRTSKETKPVATASQE
jgi:general secretion pathway protein A